MPSKQSASSELPKHQQDRKKWPGTSQTYSYTNVGKKEKRRRKGGRSKKENKRNEEEIQKKKKITNTEENVAQGTEGNSSQYGIRYCK